MEGLQWSSLEDTGADTRKQPSSVDKKSKKPEHDLVHKYPSSAHYTRDWDKLVADVKKEEKDEKHEGDAALNHLFQQIYKDGSDEVRKAMNKSFVSFNIFGHGCKDGCGCGKEHLFQLSTWYICITARILGVGSFRFRIGGLVTF